MSVSYMIRWVSTGKALFTKATTLAGRDATAWRPQGGKVAFWGMPPSSSMTQARLYVYDIGERRLTPAGPFPKVAFTGLAWSPDGVRVAYALRDLTAAVDVAALWTIDPAAPSTPTALGEGSLPAWLP